MYQKPVNKLPMNKLVNFYVMFLQYLFSYLVNQQNSVKWWAKLHFLQFWSHFQGIWDNLNVAEHLYYHIMYHQTCHSPLHIDIIYAIYETFCLMARVVGTECIFKHHMLFLASFKYFNFVHNKAYMYLPKYICLHFHNTF
jgi:hypothetical protein